MLEEYFERYYTICSSRGSFGAKLKTWRAKEFREALESKTKVISKAGGAIIRFEFDGVECIYVAPDLVIFELGSGKNSEDAKNFLNKLAKIISKK